MLTMWMEGCSEREIAERLGTPERRVRRLLERMRGLVEHRGFPGLFRSLSGSKARAVPPPPPPEGDAPQSPSKSKPRPAAASPMAMSIYGVEQLTN